MIKRLWVAIALVISMASMAAAATVAVATGNVNLRAGPSTGYPVVVVVPVGARIVTHGCLPGYTWCDIGFASYRGWVSARYVQVVYNGAPVVLTPAVAATVGVAVVAFNKAYWDNYYVRYPWYRSWSVYAVPPRAVYGAYPRARVDSYGRSVECADGSCTATRGVTGIYGGSSQQTRTCADGACTATRNTVGPYGGTASRTRTCSRADASCSVTRTGPRGGAMSGTRFFRQ
ncbi:SH3 domain-containing protein [Rhizobium sophorae]|uniref:SH3 domain-containing protein n=1 Tax=Rhizobium sophorae TaxID=1535242 RepID=A0A7Y3SDQ1_9HYPH|nr:SH3 domain-containing protein [Rhizobium sophorae]MBX4859338.1 SH3 domain-containing protein [Rhizobium bangladeshense]NKK70894.1 SH3 domain-containing protein [Rhizobium leguminosarum bv. viciae]NNU41691.1 SH3 domain-containing protein [Rhizobium sophorae]